MNPMLEMAVEETDATSEERTAGSVEGKVIPTQMRMRVHPPAVSAAVVVAVVAAAVVVQ